MLTEVFALPTHFLAIKKLLAIERHVLPVSVRVSVVKSGLV